MDFEKDVHAQSLLALTHADLILFVVDGKEELTASDRAVAEHLRKRSKEHVSILLVIAKCDTAARIQDARTQFYELGVGEELFPVSALHGQGIEELREAVEKQLKKMHFGEGKVRKVGNEGKVGSEEQEIPRVAIVGRPNVGKSSLVNALMSDEQRQISSRLTGPLPGTTRDATDTVIRAHGKEYIFVDTAGLRKKSRVERFGIEAFSVLRATTAIEEADVTVLVLDPLQGFGKQDKHIAGIAVEEGTGLILLVNKLDLLLREQRDDVRKSLPAFFPFCRWAAILLTSALTRENLPTLFELIDAVAENRKRRIETPVLHRLLRDLAMQHPSLAGKGSPLLSATQVSICPPTFLLSLRHSQRMHVSSLRYLENRLRELAAFDGTPIRWIRDALAEHREEM